ncbi:MAG: lipocalin-like domain-containing protein [Muribaculaceae bacterium]|nr:lipocalin-like domain-containing protein [Muribaculaceae bacterium]
MKYLKFIMLALSLTALIGISSCRKVSHNGKLDGQWQIMTIEETATGSVSEPSQREYICINLHVIQLTGPSRLTGNMTYDKKGETLSCDFPYVKADEVDRLLGQYGIYANPVTLDVVKVDGKSLVLRSDRSLITCRRF